MVACTREFALSDNQHLDAIYRGITTIPLPSDISGYRDAAAMRIVLAPDGKTVLNMPQTDSQKVHRRADGSFEITVRMPVATPRGEFPYTDSDAQIREAMSPTESCDSADRQIVNAARDVIGNAHDTHRACKSLERFVWSHIVAKVQSKDTKASEIFRNRVGTCKEHAILLAAMARAVGISSRLAVGVVSDGGNQLCGHEWVQCYIGDRWVDYDAALEGFDVSHIALWTGAGDVEYANLLGKFGHLKAVEVSLERPGHSWLLWLSPIPFVCALAFAFWRQRRRTRGR